MQSAQGGAGLFGPLKMWVPVLLWLAVPQKPKFRELHGAEQILALETGGTGGVYSEDKRCKNKPTFAEPLLCAKCCQGCRGFSKD